MEILVIYGSPRLTSNSAAIAERIIAPFEESGANVRRFGINLMRCRACQACYGCKKDDDGGCVIRDDMAPALDAVVNCDLLLLASPVYFGEVTAQMKSFIDRMYGFYLPNFMQRERMSRLKPGKILSFVMTQGHPDKSMFADIAPRYMKLLASSGFVDGGILCACGLSPERDVTGCPEIMAEADALSRRLAGMLKG